jgi:hypothetical protein
MARPPFVCPTCPLLLSPSLPLRPFLLSMADLLPVPVAGRSVTVSNRPGRFGQLTFTGYQIGARKLLALFRLEWKHGVAHAPQFPQFRPLTLSVPLPTGASERGSYE